MNDVSNHLTALDEDAAMRAAIRRDMLRANSMVAVVFGALLLLALVAGLAGLRATRNLHRAEEAEAVSQERLASAYLAQARAIRIAAEPGRRQAALNAVSNAALISRSTELRTEAIACLALPDLAQEGGLITTPRNIIAAEMDGNGQNFAYADDTGKVFVRRGPNGAWSAVPLQQRTVSLTLSPDGSFLAAKSAGGTIALWDVANARELALPPLSAELGILFSADSKRLLFSDAAADGRLAIFDLTAGAKTDTAVRVGTHVFRATRALSRVAVSAGPNVDIIDFKSGATNMVLNHDLRVSSLAWSADGHKLAVACDNGNIYLWDVTRGVRRVLAGHSAHCTDLEFSPNGGLLVSSAQDGTTRLWDTGRYQTIALGDGVAHHFTPDGKTISFWRAWQGFGAWRVASSSCYALLPGEATAGPLFSLDLSATGRWCAGTLDFGFQIWDLANGRQLYFPLTNVYCVRITPDERSLLVGDRRGLAIWPLGVASNGDILLQPEQARPIPLPDGFGARAVAVDARCRTAVVELTDHRLAVIDTSGSQKPVFIQGRWRTTNFKGPASATGAGRFAISPDGRWVATGFVFGPEDVPEIWDARTGALVVKLAARTSALGFGADGRWLGLAGTDQYSFWSTGSWQEKLRFDRDEPALTHGILAFTGDGGTVAVSHNRQVVQLRDFPSNNVIANLIAPAPQTLNASRIAADGSVLVSATANDMVEVWRLDLMRKDLAGLGLDWGPGAAPAPAPAQPNSLGLTLTLAAALGGFLLAAGFTLLTLRRHRRAIQRFVVAEAMAAQRNRELDTAKAELMHSQKMRALGTLATGIAHDFNNLLSVVRMSNKLIGREAPNHAEIQEHVSDIEQAVLQGKAVVGSMLGYARERESDSEPVDVSLAVEEVVSLLSKEFLRGITLTLELERDLPKIAMGRGPLEQILLNLVVNASEAMQGAGRLRITARSQPPVPAGNYVMRPAAADGYVELTVADSGPGIAPELAERVFEPFFTTKNFGARPGTGLGLSLVYSMAQQAGAGLSLETAPGLGAAFTLVFPVKATAPVRQTHSAEREEPA